MAKISRKQQKIFAGSASNNGQFGSAQAGTKVTDTDLDVLQALTAFANGWNDATVSSQKLPVLEEMQALHYITTTQIAYLFQEGIAEYNTDTNYFINSIVKKSGTYELYGSIVDDNQGNALPVQADNASWQYLGDLAELKNIGAGNEVFIAQHLLPSGNDAGGTLAATWNQRPINTVNKNTISGASLSSNIITLPAGTYKVDIAAAGYDLDANKIRLYNNTDAATEIVGLNNFTNVTGSNATLSGEITIASAKDFVVEHYSQNTTASNGLGRSVSSGDEIYLNINITKKG